MGAVTNGGKRRASKKQARPAKKAAPKRPRVAKSTTPAAPAPTVVQTKEPVTPPSPEQATTQPAPITQGGEKVIQPAGRKISWKSLSNALGNVVVVLAGFALVLLVVVLFAELRTANARADYLATLTEETAQRYLMSIGLPPNSGSAMQSTTEAPPTGITAAVPAQGTSDQAVLAEPTPYPVSIAGGDFFALGVEDLGDGWSRLREAGNRDYCAWSTQWKLELSSGIAAQFPHCWELRLTGTGSVVFTARPDEIGYATSDTLGTGLAFWPSGNNGEYRVRHDNGDWTTWIPLTTGPEGVNFALTSAEVTIEFRLDDGYMAMPLGEIRNNVLPAN